MDQRNTSFSHRLLDTPNQNRIIFAAASNDLRHIPAETKKRRLTDTVNPCHQSVVLLGIDLQNSLNFGQHKWAENCLLCSALLCSYCISSRLSTPCLYQNLNLVYHNFKNLKSLNGQKIPRNKKHLCSQICSAHREPSATQAGRFPTQLILTRYRYFFIIIGKYFPLT